MQPGVQLDRDELALPHWSKPKLKTRNNSLQENPHLELQVEGGGGTQQWNYHITMITP